MKFVKKEYIRYLEWAFKLSYLLLGLVTFNSFLYDSPVQPFLVKACLVLGVLTLLGRIICWEDYIKTPYLAVLSLFCVSFFVTILANREYGQVSGDIKWLIWTGILFFLLYMCDTKRNTEAYKKEFILFSHILIVWNAISSAASLFLMSQLYHEKWFTASGELMLAGFQWGRLWGVYTDPNYGSVFSVVVILLCVFYIRRYKTWKKIPYAGVVILSYLYIVFSDSRTAEVAMIISAVFWILLNTVYKKKAVKEFLVRMIIAVFFSVVFLAGTSGIKKEYNTEIQRQINEIEAKKNTVQNGVQNHADKNKTNGKKQQQVGRAQDLEKDVTNGRIALWESGVEVWKTSPVFGVGYNSFIPYVLKNLPETYAVRNSQGTNYVSLHNEFINILAYQGILGIGVFLTFILLLFLLWAKVIRKIEEKDRDYIAVLSACVLAIGVSMVFLLEGLYTNSPGTFILWSFVGYIAHYCRKTGKAEP